MDTQAAASLLDEFDSLQGRISRPQTFMEIGGYPHYENVCSNFLAFFFDPEGPHGLSSLFLDAMVGAVGIEGVEGGLGGNVSVEREVFTGAGNRIDILVKSDSHAVLIENKIFAAVANPFEDYAAYLGRSNNENGERYSDENKIKILLTLYPSREGSEWGFVNVTHAHFAGAVRSSLGHYLSTADTRYLTLMLDFLNTLENLGEGTRMNQGYIELLGARSDDVERFLRAIIDVRAELRGKVQRLAPLIIMEGYQNGHIEQILWKPNIPLAHYLHHRIHIDEQSYVVIEPVISPSGWEIHIFQRVHPKSHNSQELQTLLNEKGIPPEVDTVVHDKRFEYEEDDLGSIAAVVEEELASKAAIVQQVRDQVSKPTG